MAYRKEPSCAMINAWDSDNLVWHEGTPCIRQWICQKAPLQLILTILTRSSRSEQKWLLRHKTQATDADSGVETYCTSQHI